jgi:2-polyprenyl-3-methyl-5-hydroxy-6-metoxy-1,4-benzoquinol methylase
MVSQGELVWSGHRYPVIDQARIQTGRSHLVRGSAQELPFSEGTFDLVIALHLVEHLPQPERFFAEARRVVRNKGLLMIATPNPKGIRARLMGKSWAGWQDESHINLNPPAYWREPISGNGFVLRMAPRACLASLFFGNYPWPRLTGCPCSCSVSSHGCTARLTCV